MYIHMNAVYIIVQLFPSIEGYAFDEATKDFYWQFVHLNIAYFVQPYQ